MSTECGPAPNGSGAPTASVVGSIARMVLSASLTTSTGPTGLLGGGAVTSSGCEPTSIVPDSLLASRLATARSWADGSPSAANTVSELGAAPTARGARSN